MYRHEAIEPFADFVKDLKTRGKLQPYFVVMSVEQLEAEVLKLPRSIRAQLAERLIASLDENSEIEQAWTEEAERRYRQYLAGGIETIAVEDALARVRADLAE